MKLQVGVELVNFFLRGLYVLDSSGIPFLAIKIQISVTLNEALSL